MLNQNSQFQSNEERIYNSGRINILVMVGFTLINVILLALESNRYFLFFAYIPLFLYGVGFESANIFIGIIAALFVLFIYVFCFFMSKKKYGWMAVALVMFSFDTLYFIFSFGLKADLIIDYVFHGWVLFYLIRSATVIKALKRKKEEVSLITEQNIEEVDASAAENN